MQAADQVHTQTYTPALAVGGEMEALIHELDWAQTPLGPISSWSPSLNMIVRFLLANRFPLLLWWGPQFRQLYNDPYRPVLGAKHPKSLGQPASECWPEIWEIIGPLIETPFNGGPATWIEDLFLEIDRYGFVEETHFTVAYSPVPDETIPSGIGGVLATVHEISEKVVGERRVLVLRDIGAQSIEAKAAEEACALVAETLAQHPKDIPFALLYLIEPDRRRARLAGAAGIAQDGPASPLVIDLDEQAGDRPAWPLAEVVRTQTMQIVEDLAGRFGDAVPPGPWSDPPYQAVVAPIRSQIAHQLAGLLVAGVSSRLRFDESYRSFIELAASQIATAIANARAYDEERKRAEALAELDRAKTAFFSNVSHEFRTPLTLMLGPLVDLLQQADGALPQEQRQQLEVVHRNGLRLLKLVNTLLDFSRIEAGRIKALYEPTDLAALTAELASAFRSAIERAGIRLLVDCPPLAEAIYVDREMWEKIVFNLLSNALKFTFAGEIAVSLRQSGDLVELTIRDTGTGIPAEELPHLFERFHRVAGARGRTFEGSGIGLALIQELARLHGGTVRVASEVDRGSVFTVAIPRGVAHLPADHIGAGHTLASTALPSEAYVEGLLRWLPEPGIRDQGSGIGGVATGDERSPATEPPPTLSRSPAPDPRPLVLLADDNADMRDYVRRLLSERYTVEAVADGAAALAAARKHVPDLVLTDVMMPHLDGFGLLRELRADPRIAEVPVIMLSARAGEEARSDGLDAGADDYLIKPFSARELLARVGACLALARMRREAAAREAALRAAAEASREALEQVLASISDAFVTFDRDWRYTHINDRAVALLGRPKEALLSRNVWELFPELVGQLSQRELSRAMAERIPVRFEFFHSGLGIWYENRTYPMADGLAVFFSDISARKRVEEALRESENRLRLAVEAGAIGIWDIDLRNGVRTWSEQGKAIYGLAAHEPIDYERQLGLIHPDDRARAHALVTAFRDQGTLKFLDFEHRIVRPDGSLCWVAVRGEAIYDGGPLPVRLIGTLIDITERKRTEQASRFLADIGEIIRLASDPAEVLDKVAQAVAEHLQVRRCLFIEIDALHDRGVIRSEYCRGVHSVAEEYKISDYSAVALAEMTAGRTIINHDSQSDPRTAAIYETTYHPNGERAYVAVPLMRNGRWNGTLWISDDAPRRWQPREIRLLETVAEHVWLAIEKLRVEQALRESDARLRLALEAARMVAWEWDTLRNQIITTDSFEEIYGIPALRMAVEGFQLVHPDDLAQRQHAIQHALTDGHTYHSEFRIVRPDNQQIVWLEEWGFAVANQAGASHKLVGVAMDITARKQAEFERARLYASEQAARAAAEQAVHIRDVFLSVASHELKTPLTALLGNAQLLQRRAAREGGVSERSQHAIDVISNQAGRLNKMVAALLDISRIETGQLTIERALVDLEALVRRVVAEIQPTTDKHPITLTVADASLLVEGDELRLEQVVQNLIGNAIKYTPQGGPIGVRIQRQGNGAAVAVTDTGIGIPPSAIPQLFGRFYRAENVDARNIPGMGIGLFVVKEIMALHGGKIEVESSEGHGTTFTIWLPLIDRP